MYNPRAGVEANQSSKCRRWVARLLTMGWAYTAMVLAWGYMGGLTSLLAVRHVPQPFQTLASLGNHPSMILVVQANTAVAHMLQVLVLSLSLSRSLSLSLSLSLSSVHAGPS